MGLIVGKNEILVSAYLLTYNHEKYVAQALDSMLNQKTNFKYEILIGDDCSTDNTPSILKEYKKKYPDKIKLFLRDKNLGGTKNNSLLLKECTGRYIAPLEGDDYWLGDNRLQYLVDFLEENPEYVGVSHRRERRDIEGNLLGYDPSNEVINKPFVVNNFLKGKRFSAAGVVYRNIYLNAGDKYDSISQASRNLGDFQTCMFLLDIGPIYVTDRCFGVYRVRKGPGESNYNSITAPLDSYFDHIHLIRAVDGFFSRKYDFTREITGRQFNALLYCLKKGKFKDLGSVLSTIRFKEGINLLLTLPYRISGWVLMHIKNHKEKEVKIR